MSILIFIIILSTLIIVHELGHFLVAKKFGIRVDEFGLGFPPRAKELFIWRKTLFTLNWLPFGGFVKIFGENPATSDEVDSQVSESEEGKVIDNNASTAPDSFQSKNRAIQATVLVAGVFGNFLFAWFLISLGFLTGLPSPVGIYVPVEDAQTTITLVLPDSPAGEAGLKSGDVILSLSRGEDVIPESGGEAVSPEEASQFIAVSSEPIIFEINRGGEVSQKSVTPEEGIIADQRAVGISMDLVGIAKLPPHEALWYGLRTTTELTVLTGQAITSFIGQSFTGKADLSGVTGPVGIVGMVGDVRELGFAYLLTFTALISINLAIINLLPFPALDGGRLFFVLVEAITRKPVPLKVFNVVNAAGFALLILLMVVITIQDIRNIF
ncbi:MAG: RIP metalloprotease RseP [Candidatus Zambryskibacteria bacterium CG_4_9_14_3_um_filter_42_9]|uniref:Zinc metalloprotease n=1 Tax=Candidatus Zambryskibacteria bacterium CG22_combo_CG10-13_8_21_14_all_42_17 TaxID=1975118 RepID=A0A2H0BE91_9BACT|nr:MAG: RIP metalloprotease RseP [Candidatus Zambryskibacteria bacterium CG22_combo_CG10-13_8_21_14_all_42_17]PJA36861.1 MAG: RIP metalloprotease RseP [Candidatus Zambryskibacteria bacterium CG_4_9_14_3_um_filter_42_9]